LGMVQAKNYLTECVQKWKNYLWKIFIPF
jgi:hypothetical protein